MNKPTLATASVLGVVLLSGCGQGRNVGTIDSGLKRDATSVSPRNQENVMQATKPSEQEILLTRLERYLE